MNLQQKLNSRDTEITKLKRLWRDSFTEEDRDYWRELFTSSKSRPELRQELREKLNINLLHDRQLLRFRQWDVRFAAAQEEKEHAAADKAELEALGLPEAEIRAELLRRMKARALACGDFNLGLKAISADVKVETLQLGRDKFNLASHTKIEAGLDVLAVHIKGNPAARTAYDAFRNLIKAAAT